MRELLAGLIIVVPWLIGVAWIAIVVINVLRERLPESMAALRAEGGREPGETRRERSTPPSRFANEAPTPIEQRIDAARARRAQARARARETAAQTRVRQLRG